MLDDINKAKYNFITLIISIVSFITLKKTSDSFVKQFGDQVKISNLFVDGYLSSFMQIIGLIFITIVLFCITIFIGWKLLSFTSGIQMIISVIFIFCTFNISLVPFLGTLFLLIIITVILMFLANDS